LVETAFVILAAALSHRLANALEQLDSAIHSVVFGESPALPLDGRRAANEILGEMARSRRHRRPLSVTVLALDPTSLELAIDSADEEVQRAVRSRYVHGKIAQTIADQLRRSDLLFEDPATGHFVVVSPETSSDGTSLLVERIGRAIQPTSVKLSSGHATFPDNAVTFEQLVERAQEQMDSPASRPVEQDIVEGAA
ncbi:MAG: GGDEF domain-containing protein, partial [Acidimicrobiia bacterium]|nr:GGDEF domain-containing protein [Acidimicrobiia bacterium]